MQRRLTWLVLIGGAVAAAVALAVTHLQRLPRGPQPVAWDREACAECRMHVGEPGFAAQLQTLDGEVLNFDDPGCLLRYQAERRPRVHAIYFHRRDQDGWLSAEQTAFVHAEASPMGYDLAVVERGTPSALSYEEAKRRVVESRR
jgi:copper chaperone NosL